MRNKLYILLLIVACAAIATRAQTPPENQPQPASPTPQGVMFAGSRQPRSATSETAT